jgi:PAS domain S-box-containing protein
MPASGQSQPAGASVEAIDARIMKAKAQLEQMIDMNPESMVLIDFEGKIVRANRAFLQLLSIEDYRVVLGKALNDMFPSIDSEFFKEIYRGGGGYERRDAVEQRNSGAERQLQFGVVRSGGDSESLIIIVHDVTEERKEAAMLEKSYKVEAVQALMGALMHHLNQPLTVLMVRAKMMALALEDGTASTDDLKSTLANIQDLSMKMANMLKKVEQSDGFQTQEYLAGLDILKIDD